MKGISSRPSLRTWGEELRATGGHKNNPTRSRPTPICGWSIPHTQNWSAFERIWFVGSGYTSRPRWCMWCCDYGRMLLARSRNGKDIITPFLAGFERLPARFFFGSRVETWLVLFSSSGYLSLTSRMCDGGARVGGIKNWISFDAKHVRFEKSIVCIFK